MADDPPKPSESQKSFPLVDSLPGNETFAHEVTVFFVHGGVVSMTFESARVDHTMNPGPISRVVVCRLTMPIGGAQRLAVGLFDFLKSRGLDPAPVPPKEQMN